MMEMFAQLQREKGITIVLVTHQMNDVSDYADYDCVNCGKTGTPEEVFADAAWLQEKQLGFCLRLFSLSKAKSKRIPNRRSSNELGSFSRLTCFTFEKRR